MVRCFCSLAVRLARDITRCLVRIFRGRQRPGVQPRVEWRPPQSIPRSGSFCTRAWNIVPGAPSSKSLFMDTGSPRHPSLLTSLDWAHGSMRRLWPDAANARAFALSTGCIASSMHTPTRSLTEKIKAGKRRNRQRWPSFARCAMTCWKSFSIWRRRCSLLRLTFDAPSTFRNIGRVRRAMLDCLPAQAAARSSNLFFCECWFC